MLTELILGNFVHFKERQVLPFHKGLNILLGRNHTGKTSVIEAVRRCMSVSKNSGLSNSHDTNKISYATCKFENTDSTVYSSVITVPVFERVVTLKAVKRICGSQEEIAVDILRHVRRSHHLVNEELRPENLNFKLLNGDNEEELEKQVMQYIRVVVGKTKVVSFYSDRPGKMKDTPCEKILKDHVDETAVIIFPFRSFSPYQWTKSKRDMTHLAGDISDEIGLKREVVFWYLKQGDKISKETRDLEKKYFNFITGNSGFEFELEEGNRVGIHNIHCVATNPGPSATNPSSRTENLLKIPEGIYEAKSAAIILAVEQFRTICLDDAERGMHPQMIERLRDLVLKNISDKVVLLITHHPTFLAPWNISRIFFFQRLKDSDSYIFTIKSLADQVIGKECQFITSGQFSSIFFAERILWVEGKTEYLFFTALKYEFLQQNLKGLEVYFKEGEDQQKRFQDFLSTLHIVSMDGEANKVLARKKSLDLGIDHFFILDFDALHNNVPGEEGTSLHQTSGELNFQKIISKFSKAFSVNVADVEKITTMDQVVNELDRQGIFVWKLTDNHEISTGAIEHVVDRMCKKNRTLLKVLKENKIELKQKKKTKFEKLFKDKDDNDISQGVSKLLEFAMKDESSDLYRCIIFLIAMSDEKLSGGRETTQRKRKRNESQEQQSAEMDNRPVTRSFKAGRL